MDARYWQPFVTAMTQIGLALMRAEPPGSTISAQWQALSDLRGEVVLEALARGLREWTTFPAPKDIRKMANVVAGEREARQNADRAAYALRPSRYSFLLAQLMDPEVSEAKKERIRAEWHRQNPNEKPPWEDTCRPMSMSA